MSVAHVYLSREVRFGLQEPVTDKSASNSFAGNPALGSLTPFVALTVTMSGPIDASTGMLVNIKVIDAVVRETAVEKIRDAARSSPTGVGVLVAELFHLMERHLGVPAERRVERIALELSPYLSVSAFREELPMVRLSQKFEFSAAHRLHAAGLTDAENREVFGRCNNPNGHGHNYELEVTISGKPGAAGGIVMPIHELQKIVNERVIDVFDHKHLNLDCADFRDVNPTVENIAKVLYRRLAPGLPAGVRLASIRLWETPKTMCEYSE
jgi:6-pyruvoyltetrahydropterin/6-carboxytetrahydropterin synthase